MKDEKKAKIVVLPPNLDATEIMDMTLKCWAKGRYVDFLFYEMEDEENQREII